MPKVSISKKLGSLRGIHTLVIFIGTLAILVCIATFSKAYSFRSFLLADTKCSYRSFNPNRAEFSRTVELVADRIRKQLDRLRDSPHESLPKSEHASFLADILGLIESAHESLSSPGNAHREDVHRNHEINGDYFLTEEIRKYIKIKPNRLGKRNFMGTNATFASIGHGCFAMKEELEQYMDYDVGDICDDDWQLGQKLMISGCDPLPRRRCFTRAPQLYTKPLPINESLWAPPDDRNIRWSHYRCKNFTCLSTNSTRKGFFKCASCFDLVHHESPRWIEPARQDPSSNPTSDFTISEVLGLKPGEIRMGLDFSIGTGSFAARMLEHNITVVSVAINLGAPFSETIALRGLVPLYLTINQRLPFFDNTLDLIHTTRFLDGWIDPVLLDFVLYDWDRALRPGGILWIDSFFCLKEDLDDYLQVFRVLRYRKHKWIVVPKLDKINDGKEVFFSAVLEKPARPFR